MVEMIFYNKAVIIKDKDKTKWNYLYQNTGPLVSNTIK